MHGQKTVLPSMVNGVVWEKIPTCFVALVSRALAQRIEKAMTTPHPGCRPFRASIIAISVAAAVSLAGCSDDEVSGADTGAGTGGGGAAVENRSSLKTLADRQAFMGELRSALENQYSIATGISVDAPDAATDALTAGTTGGTDGGTTGGAGAGESGIAPGNTLGGAPAGDAGEAGDFIATDDVSATNVQEAGVDEQDRVKTDGERIYVLSSGNPGAVVFAGGGLDDAVLADSPIGPGGNPNPTILRVLDMDRETPDAIPVADINVDLDGRTADGFYLSGDADSRAAIVVSGGFGGYGFWADSYSYGRSDTVVARVPLADPTTAAVDASLRIDGQAVSSRRIDNRLFIATRFYPQLDGIDPWNVDPQTWVEAVAATSEEDLLPAWTDTDGNRTTLIDPASCFVAERPADSLYYSADIITLSVVDLDTMQPIDSECYLGNSETLYASPEAVFLATTRWDYSFGPTTAEGDVIDPDTAGLTADIAFYDPRVDTDIHRFEITDAGLDYSASGSVNGHLGWNPERMPYRLSDYNGDLRVAVMPSVLLADTSPIVLNVLRDNGSGELELIAQLPNEARPAPIGKPYEQLYASRFVGDRAYLVTFRQTDPLYVVDLSRPRDPELLGELEITGYSDWLLPIGSNHLLGLGKDAVAIEDGIGDGRGGLQQGVKLSLFDVSDPSAPREVSSQTIGERGTDSVALYNPRAIAIQAATDAHPTRVAFGIDVAGSAAAPPLESITEPWNWRPWSYTGLHGFDIRTGADARIEARGALVVDTTYGDDRAVLAGDAAFYVHGDRVRAARWDSLSNSSPAR